MNDTTLIICSSDAPVMMENTLQDALFLKSARFFSRPALKSANKNTIICVKER